MKMIVVKNRIFPCRGYKAMTVWPFVFTSCELTEKDLRHEEIHGRQQIEILPISILLAEVIHCFGGGLWSVLGLFLYLWLYIGLYLVAKLRGAKDAYRENAMEREAYMFEGDDTYLIRRRLFAWLTFLKY